jgi:hypothetical protein
MWMIIIGLIPYVIMGQVIASLDIEMGQWQWWTIWGCLIVSDIISHIKAKLED